MYYHIYCTVTRGTIDPNATAPPEITLKFLKSKQPYVPGMHQTASSATLEREIALQEYGAT